METVYEKWKKFVNEDSDVIPTVYQALCVLETKREENLTEILTGIRAIKGVTVVTMVEPHALAAEERRKSIIKIKFIPVRGFSLSNYLYHLDSQVANIPGVYALDIKKYEAIQDKTS